MSDRLGQKMMMRAMRRRDLVVGFQRHGGSHGHRLLPDTAVNRTLDHWLNYVQQNLLELANDLQAKISPNELAAASLASG